MEDYSLVIWADLNESGYCLYIVPNIKIDKEIREILEAGHDCFDNYDTENAKVRILFNMLEEDQEYLEKGIAEKYHQWLVPYKEKEEIQPPIEKIITHIYQIFLSIN